jgi:ABC-type multidrug transport system ATPase subunit
MLRIQLDNAAKRFQYEWIFRNLSLEIPANSNLAITGGNGSGKSTFLKAIASLYPLTEGNLKYFFGEKEILGEDIYKQLTFSAPYLELPEELTLLELLKFHFKFKNPVAELSFEKMIEFMYLENHKNKPISQFSSGMKQRLKLGLCFFSDVSLVLLDEPTSNLDEKGISWYLEIVQKFGSNKTLLICSNNKREYAFCKQILNIENYKFKPNIL